MCNTPAIDVIIEPISIPTTIGFISIVVDKHKAVVIKKTKFIHWVLLVLGSIDDDDDDDDDGVVGGTGTGTDGGGAGGTTINDNTTDRVDPGVTGGGEGGGPPPGVTGGEGRPPTTPGVTGADGPVDGNCAGFCVVDSCTAPPCVGCAFCNSGGTGTPPGSPEVVVPDGGVNNVNNVNVDGVTSPPTPVFVPPTFPPTPVFVPPVTVTTPPPPPPITPITQPQFRTSTAVLNVNNYNNIGAQLVRPTYTRSNNRLSSSSSFSF